MFGGGARLTLEAFPISGFLFFCLSNQGRTNTLSPCVAAPVLGHL